MYFHLDFKSQILTSENKSSSSVQMNKNTFEGNNKYYPIWKHVKTSDNFSVSIFIDLEDKNQTKLGPWKDILF